VKSKQEIITSVKTSFNRDKKRATCKVKPLTVLFLLSFVIYLPTARAQSPKQLSKYAEQALEEQDYYGASIYFKKSLRLDSTDTATRFKYGEALRLSNNYIEAEKQYQQVHNSTETEKYPESLFWLASMQKNNGHYHDARHNFQKFYKSYPNKSSYFSKKAKNEVKACAFAQKLILDTADVLLNNAGQNLNSSGSDFNAIQVNDSSILISSLKSAKIEDNLSIEDDEYYIHLFQSNREGNSWSAPTLLDTVINKPSKHTANGSFTPDGNTFYFSVCDDEFNCKIYSSEKLKGKWTTAKELGPEINLIGSNNTQPFFAQIKNKEILYFVSNRDRGKGGLDLWYAELNGKRIKVKNLGKNVNSVDDEISPYYDTEENMLYFSSTWHYGLGGMDVFKAEGAYKPKKPHNIGLPYNSSANDMYYSYNRTANKGLLTSNRVGSFSDKSATCCNDIYEFKFPMDEILAATPKREYETLEELNKYLPVTLYFHNDEPNPKTRNTTTDLNYMTTYNAYSELTPKYKMEYAEGLKGIDSTKAIEDIDNFFLDYVDEGVEDLELFSELLLEELQKGQHIELTIRGHASPLAKTDYNVKLTLRRVSSLINYLSEYQDGIYLPYIKHLSPDAGKLDFIKIPFGEYKAADIVSDNFHDQRNSVYSRNAALERKIEIISVHQSGIDSVENPKVKFDSEVFDFGKIKEREKVTHTFKLKNIGNADLIISHAETFCGCTRIKAPFTPIPPNETAEIEVEFDAAGKKGMQHESIELLLNTKDGKKVISITAEVK